MGSCVTTPIIQLHHFLLFMLFVFPHLHMLHFSSCTSRDDVNAGCIGVERQALLKFKQALTDPSGRLSSWQGEDCCKWTGLTCNNNTGHIIKLDLHNPFNTMSVVTENDEVAYKRSCLGGEINPSLVHLKHLHYLDLSNNDFGGINIPSFIGSLKKMRQLYLSNACFSGAIPPDLGNLSSLHYLNLHCFCLQNYEMGLMAGSLQWLSGLSSLRYLNMSEVDLNGTATDWLDHVNMLPALLELDLQGCRLHNLPSSLPFVNFTSLAVLQLSMNRFNPSIIPQWLTKLNSLSTLVLSTIELQGPIPNALGTMTSLQYIDLSFNQIDGRIPRSFGDLCNLKELSLPGNNISGEITDFLDGLSACPNKSLERLNLAHNRINGLLPNSIGSFKNLKSLNLHGNRMNGTIPESVGGLSMLTVLVLSGNSWEGALSESHFTNLAKLEDIGISSTSEKTLVLNVSTNWIPPFSSLQYADMTNCQLGPLFPSWLQSQKNLSILSLRNTRIADNLPHWFSNLSQLNILDLSYNQIRGRIPSEFHLEPSTNLSFTRSNDPLLPHFPNMDMLLLGGNFFSGSIPSNIGKAMPRLLHLDLSMNLIHGRIPPSICELIALRSVVLSDNGLTGKIPQLCWKDFEILAYVDLANNNLTGKVPSSFFLSPLKYLKLSNNKFYGELPSSLEESSKLVSLDLGENNLSGKVPAWIGKGLPFLKVFRLHSNHFTGEIPSQLCFLSSLQVLDLGRNELSGAVPRCFGNLSAMAVVGIDGYDDIGIGISWSTRNNEFSIETIVTVVKGRELNYSSNLRFLKSIDLSNNSLSGDIPQDLTKLVGLGILNLSTNHFKGVIPEKIGQLEQLESLDLSHNQLSGPIPPSITSLSFLNHLNFSYNNLTGQIPSSNQLQTLNDSSIYEGNSGLCGPPLMRKCKGYETTEGPSFNGGNKEDDDEEFGMLSFYISMGVGFIVGFWGVCGVLVLKKSWRYSYFQFVDDIKDRIYVFMAIRMAHMQGWRC